MRSKLFVLAAAAVTLLAGCDQPTGPSASAAKAEQKATSSINPATGELEANNYRSIGTVVTIPGVLGNASLAFEPIEPTEPCGIDYPCEPCDPNDPYGPCYNPPQPCSALITGFNTVRTGIQPYGSLEVSGTTSSSCGYLVMTGIGARINGSDDYTTLHLRGRRVYPNGTFGETVTYRFGSSPNHSLEAWAEVPPTDNYAIVGVAIGQSGTEDVRTLVINYRKIEITAAGVRLTGPVYTQGFGGNPYGYTDASYLTYADNEVFVGAGFRSIDDGERTATMASHIGYLP